MRELLYAIPAKVVPERIGNVAQELSGGNPAASYLLGSGMSQRYARTDTSGTQSYLADALGSVIGLASSAGTVQTSYAYDPSGQATLTGTASASPYQYAGQPSDGTGLQYNLARYYDPSLGRFISQDPAGLTGSGVNLYAYASGNPLNFTDPAGLRHTKNSSFSWQGLLDLAAGAVCVFASVGLCMIGGVIFAWAVYGASVYDTGSWTVGLPQLALNLITTSWLGVMGKVISGGVESLLGALSQDALDRAFLWNEGWWTLPLTSYGEHATGTDWVTMGAIVFANLADEIASYFLSDCTIQFSGALN